MATPTLKARDCRPTVRPPCLTFCLFRALRVRVQRLPSHPTCSSGTEHWCACAACLRPVSDSVQHLSVHFEEPLSPEGGETALCLLSHVVHGDSFTNPAQTHLTRQDPAATSPSHTTATSLQTAVSSSWTRKSTFDPTVSRTTASPRERLMIIALTLFRFSTGTSEMRSGKSRR